MIKFHCTQQEGECDQFKKTHLTGVQSHGNRMAWCFVDFLRWPQDANPTITVQHLLQTSFAYSRSNMLFLRFFLFLLTIRRNRLQSHGVAYGRNLGQPFPAQLEAQRHKQIISNRQSIYNRSETITCVNLRKCSLKKGTLYWSKNVLKLIFLFLLCYVMKRRLAPNLFLQLDNCYRQCKNIHILGFCALLVKAGVFRKVSIPNEILVFYFCINFRSRE